MPCEILNLVQAYYDHELDASQTTMVESHLARCEECRALLEELQNLSGLISRAPLEPMPSSSLERIQSAWNETRDRLILRFASWATAAAAAILIGALLFWPDHSVPATPRTGLWEQAAVMPPEPSSEPGSEVVQVAQWMARDLSGREER